MTMNEALTMLGAVLAGMALGTIFYAGLWWTVRKGVASLRPALWFSVSLLLRMSIALAGIYFVSAGNWRKLAACLAGFVLARLAVMWLTRTKVKTSGGQTCILLPTR